MKAAEKSADQPLDKKTLREAVQRVANYVVEKDHRRYENWENAVNAGGLIAVDSKAYADKIRAIVDWAVAMQTSDGQLQFGLIVPGDPANVVEKWTGAGTITGTVHAATLGTVVLHQYEQEEDRHYLEAARLQFDYMMRVPRTRDGGIIHREEAHELWLDTVWFVLPFFAKYGVIAENAAALEDAVRQIEVHYDHLINLKTGLLRHIWCETPDHIPQSMYWSRGHGWVVAGIADVWELLPANHRGRAVIADILRVIVPPIVKLQDKTGLWRNILDDRRSPLESTGTLMFAYGIKKAVDLGILKGAELEDAARRGLVACLSVVYPDGSVGQAALPPGGPRARIGVAPYGQGWFLQAASRFL